MPANPAITPALRRRDYRLGDNLWARQGQVFITGTEVPAVLTGLGTQVEMFHVEQNGTFSVRPDTP